MTLRLTTALLALAACLALMTTGAVAQGKKSDSVVKATAKATKPEGGKQTVTITLEIDLSRSIVQADGKWLFLPVFASVHES